MLFWSVALKPRYLGACRGWYSRLSTTFQKRRSWTSRLECDKEQPQRSEGRTSALGRRQLSSSARLCGFLPCSSKHSNAACLNLRVSVFLGPQLLRHILGMPSTSIATSWAARAVLHKLCCPETQKPAMPLPFQW